MNNRTGYLGKTLLLATVMLAALYSCKTSKKAASSPEWKTEQGRRPEDYFRQKINYETFSGKAQMHYESKDQSQDFTANIRMRRDKDIWASIVALGGLLEAARAYVTPDSLKAIDKLGRKAYVLSYQEGARLIEAEVAFPVLQNLIIGNVLFEDAPVKDVAEKDSLIIITMDQKDVRQTLTYNKNTGLLQQAAIRSDSRDFNCDIRYEKYAAITGKQPFAYSRSVAISNKGQQIKLTMDFVKADLDVPVEMPFSISESYRLQEPGKK